MQVAIYEAAASSLAPATAAAYVVLWAPTRPIAIREIGVANSSATTTLPQLQTIRASARGTQSTTVTPTAAANAQGFIASQIAPTAVIDTAWSVQPTIAAIPMRMTDIAGTVGSGVIWNWQTDGELIVTNGAGLALWNASGGTTAVTRFYFVWSE
jgi:hypothetical protein